MATAQRTRPRAVVGAPHRAAWQLKSALRHSVSAAPRTIIFLHSFNCNYCNYILFTKLPWPGDSEGTFRSSSQTATCPPVYHTRRRLHTVPFNAERQAGKL